MTKITPKTFPKGIKKSILDGLPDYVKDPKNYSKIQTALLDALATSHSHSDLFEWSICPACQDKLKEFRLLHKKFGFRNPAQYYAWKKVMDIIMNPMKNPLVDWKNDKQQIGDKTK